MGRKRGEGGVTRGGGRCSNITEAHHTAQMFSDSKCAVLSSTFVQDRWSTTL